MMTIAATGPKVSRPIAAGQRKAGDQPPTATGTALVTVEPAIRTAATRMVRPEAAFVTHLIAMAEAPQTRARPRAEVPHALAAYRHDPAVAGRSVLQKIV